MRPYYLAASAYRTVGGGWLRFTVARSKFIVGLLAREVHSHISQGGSYQNVLLSY